MFCGGGGFLCSITGCRYLHVQTIVPVVGDAAAHLGPVKQRPGIHSRVERLGSQPWRLGSLVMHCFLGTAHLAPKHSFFSKQAPEDAPTCLFLSCCCCSLWVNGGEEGAAAALWTLPCVHPGSCPARSLSVPTSAVAAFDLSFRPSAHVGVAPPPHPPPRPRRRPSWLNQFGEPVRLHQSH